MSLSFCAIYCTLSGSYSILPRFVSRYTVSVEDDLRINKDTADLAGRSAV